MTNKKNEQKTEKTTENSYANKENSLDWSKQFIHDSQFKSYSDTKKERSLYSNNNFLKNYNFSFYSVFV